MLSIAIPFAMAQNATVTENGGSVIEGFLANVGAVVPASFVIAFVTVMLGYLRKTPPEDFEVVKFLGTLMFAIVLGIVTSLAGWNYTTAEAWLGQAGITIWVYWSAKVLAVKLGWVSAEEKSP